MATSIVSASPIHRRIFFKSLECSSLFCSVCSSQASSWSRAGQMISRQAGAVPSQAPDSTSVNTTAAQTSILQTQAEQRKRLLDEYFASTKLLNVVEDFMTKLATAYKTQFRLPANPYPNLLKVMRMHELRQTFALQSSNSVSLELAVLNGQAQIPSRFQICSVEHEAFALPIWGTKSTLELLTGVNLYGLLDQVNVSFRGLVLVKEFTDDECRGSAYGVLVGDSILGARLEHLPPSFLGLETHVFVSGVHLEKTMGVFARFLLKQLHEVASCATSFASLSPEEAAVYRGCVACDGITITPQATSSAALSDHHAAATVWGIERVMESRGAFISAVKTALVSNSLITLNRYDLVKQSTGGKSFVCQVEQTFFFHFAAEDQGNMDTNTPRQSFMTGSRALTWGLFFDSKGALEVASRFRAAAQVAPEEERKKQTQKKKQITTPENPSVAIPEERPRFGFAAILQNTVNELHRMGLASDTFREYTNDLVGCFAYNLGYLVQAHQVLVNVLCRSTGSAATLSMIQTSFMSLETWMNGFLEESNAFPPTSVLQPACSPLCKFNDQAQAASEMKDDQQINAFIEVLKRIDELLLIVVRITFSDFLDLVRAGFSKADQAVEEMHQDDVSLDDIDVLRALEMAVEERKCPASIVSEVVFAQEIVDSCLDLALESAVMNTVAVRLPPNPFIDVSIYLQVFALRQLVWRSEMQQTEQQSIIRVSSRPELFSVEGENACAVNPSLLRLVKGHQISLAQQWLEDHGVFYESTYKPPKSSYSVAVFQVMLVFHPLLFAQSSLNNIESSPILQELDVIEHYVLEGKEVNQARYFFLEAVYTDVRRLAAGPQSRTGNNCWQIQLELQALDSLGQVVTAVDLSQSTTDEFIHTFLEEATQIQLTLQLLSQIAEVKTHGDNSSLTIYKVTKAYAFRHHCTDDHDTAETLALLPPLLLFRISEYGIFFSREKALLYFKSIESDCQISRNVWTPYASKAFQFVDNFLIYELNVVHENGTKMNSSPRQRRDCELTNRLLAHSDICQLYSLEQTIKWLLDALQIKVELLTSKSRKSAAVSPNTLFSIHHRLALHIITRIEKLVDPLNHQLQFLHKTSDLISTLRAHVTRWQSIQPPTEAALELDRKQQEEAPGNIRPTPRDDPVPITEELVGSLRTTWILVMFFRFSYQLAFFANATKKREDRENLVVEERC